LYISPVEVYYKGIQQRWLVVFSQQAYDRGMKSLERKIEKEYDESNKKARQLNKEIFMCEKDAKKALKPLNKRLLYHSIQAKVDPVHQHGKKGRPKKGSVAEVVGYRISLTFIKDEERIDRHRRSKGRFILATNQMDEDSLSDIEMLKEYKEQTYTEAGFRFIKSDTFEVSSVFLKKESRIEALMMIMTLCLMIYNLGEFFLRKSLKENQETILNQLKKPTNKPTMAWICRLFHGVQVLCIQKKKEYQELVINITERLRPIIHIFGPRAEKIYGIC